jgi:hypothetical protein
MTPRLPSLGDAINLPVGLDQSGSLIYQLTGDKISSQA